MLPDLFTDFRAEWILYEDRHVIAVDKPAGMPSQSPRPEAPDDVVYRIRSFLARREGVRPDDVYLGTHQRLDARTSGVMILARSREANPGLARQFEGRSVVKEYVAGVTSFALGPNEHRIEHHLRREGAKMVISNAGTGARSPGGPSTTARRAAATRAARTNRTDRVRRADRPRPKRPGEGQTAVLFASEQQRRGEHSLVSVRLETGRMHQIRAQLAAIGSPVAGDEIYGGAPASRLLLHARRLRLRHPITDEPLDIETETPAELLRHVGVYAMERSVSGWARPSLERAAHRRYGLVEAGARNGHTTAYRLVNGDGDGFEGVVIDVYGEHAVLAVEEAFRQDDTNALAEVLTGAGFKGVYLKRRPKNPSQVAEERLRELAPNDPLSGLPAPHPLEVHEHGVPYLVRLDAGLSTGIFLDQRDNRARLIAQSNEKTVLNLFAYTGAFTVAAATGGASASLTIDASTRALEWAAEGFDHASIDRGAHLLRRGEVFAELDRLVRQKKRFDIVILDPPTFSTIGGRRWTSQRGYAALAKGAFSVAKSGGTIMACSNDSRMSLGALREHLRRGARAAGRDIRRIRDYPPPLDFPLARHGVPVLKSVWVTCG